MCVFRPKNAVLAPFLAKNEEIKGIWETKRRNVKVLEQGRINFEMVAKRGQTYSFAVIPQGTNRKWHAVEADINPPYLQRKLMMRHRRIDIRLYPFTFLLPVPVVNCLH